MSFDIVTEFENKVATFFGAPYAVATDCCTHAIELCLRYTQAKKIRCPKHTYLSVPMLANKLNIELEWVDEEWKNYYKVTPDIHDAAVFWEKGGYTFTWNFTCLSFQYQKHLSLGRGGMILMHNKDDYKKLMRMAYDGRMRYEPWRDQNVSEMGYHYYMTPEIAQLGLDKLPDAMNSEPKKWSWKDYPDLTTMEIFKSE
jgi:dTDP-4-amino-4,6-dideoxygalactose transaminase